MTKSASQQDSYSEPVESMADCQAGKQGVHACNVVQSLFCTTVVLEVVVLIVYYCSRLLRESKRDGHGLKTGSMKKGSSICMCGNPEHL